MSNYPDPVGGYDPDRQYQHNSYNDYDDEILDEEEFRRQQQARKKNNPSRPSQRRETSSNSRDTSSSSRRESASNDYENASTDARRDSRSSRDSRSGRDARSERDARNSRRADNSREQDERDYQPGPGFLTRVVNFCRSKNTHFFIGVCLILLALYLTIIGLSYISSNAEDQSRVASETVEQMVETPDSIQNVGGPSGAVMANHLFLEGLGIGSVVLIFYMFIIALALFGVKKINFWSMTFKSILIAITLSMVAGLLTINSTAPLPLGGYHGRYINLYLISHFGMIGAIIVNIGLIATIAILYLAQIVTLYNKSRERIALIKAKHDLERERKEYLQQTVRESLDDNLMQDSTPDHVDNSEVAAADADSPVVTNVPAFENVEDNIPEDDKATGIIFGTEIPAETPVVQAVTPLEIAEQPAPAEKAETSAETASETDETASATPATGTAQPTEPTFDVTTGAIEQGKENTAYEMQGPYDPKADLASFRMPPLSILNDCPMKSDNVDQEEQEANKQRITKVLGDYGIEIVKIEAIVGPTVTLYKIVPAEGVRIAKIKRLEDDIAMNLAALGIRIIAPIPGESNIGIEVPNKEPQTVSIRSILGSKAYQECNYKLPMAMGSTINNKVYIADLTKMPHLLVAGATGQGKSVGLNTIIASLIFKRHPSELKFVLVDPKMVEFSLYSRLEKHYLAKIPGAEEAVITDWSKVVDTLNSLCVEMDDRYALLKDAECRSITEYNEKFIHRRLNPDKGHRFLPYIVMIVDEFADLIMMAGKSVETPIARIAQKARAVGMHLIIATQRPSTNVITGMIKANFPGRFAFAVRQRVDSQTILDCPGANQLIGRGDMLISTGGPLQRVQCAFIDTNEVEAICHYIDDQIGFPQPYLLPDPPTEASEGGLGNVSLSDRDTLFEEVARYVVQGTTASTSNVQRKYSIGFVRAGKIMDQLEAAGIVGPATGGKPRQVLCSPEDVEMIISTL